MSSLFVSYKEYQTYAKKHGREAANVELQIMIKQKYGENTKFSCEHCAFAALAEKGYISDEELSDVHDKYMEKKKKKAYKKMGF